MEPTSWDVDSPRRDNSTRLHRRAALALILLMAAVLRLNHINQPFIDAFSWRQASTAMMADNYYRTNANIFFPEVSWTGPGPNYQGREFQTVTYLASLMYRVFGQRECIGRGISVAFSVWGIFALYQLTRRAWDEKHALATALMYALLPGAIFIDRSFLPDPAMLALTLTTVWLYLAYLQSKDRRYLIWATVVGVLAFLTKLPGVVVLPAMAYATVTILRRRGEFNVKSLRPIAAAFCLALLPIAAYYAWALYLGTHYPPYHVAGAANWIWKTGIKSYLRARYFIPDTLSDVRWWLWTPPIMVLMALGLVIRPPGRVRDTRDRDDQVPQPRTPWLFHFWALGCVIFFIVGARELSENIWNFHVFNVFAAAFAGHGLLVLATLFDRRSFAAAWRTAVVVIAMVVVVVDGQQALAGMYKPYARDSYLMGLALREHTEPGDLIVTIADDIGDPIAIYYSGRRGWVYPQAHMQDVWAPWNLVPPDPAKAILLFEDLRERGATWLGIVTRPIDDKPGRKNFWVQNPELVAHINRTCKFVEKTKSFVIYRMHPPKPPVK
jgi:4-amino-4-deoxy-L-arabinose transferase-like glycosyltransferase